MASPDLVPCYESCENVPFIKDLEGDVHAVEAVSKVFRVRSKFGRNECFAAAPFLAAVTATCLGSARSGA